MHEEIETIRGSDNPFRDIGLPEPDTSLIKADLAAEIIRVLRLRKMTGSEAAEVTGVQESDISRIRNADLKRFSIDRLVTILNRLDRKVSVKISPIETEAEPSALGAGQ